MVQSSPSINWLKSAIKLPGRPGNAWYAALIWVVLAVFVIGLLVAAATLLVVTHAHGVLFKPICFERACLSDFANAVKPAYQVVAATVGLLVAIATVGGIFVALSSYLMTAGATAFGNHISHLTVFQTYVRAEINKRPLVSEASVDVFHWYHKMFPEAGIGRIVVSEEYERVVEVLSAEITTSNLQATSAKQGSFRYVLHQGRVKAALAGFGIHCERQPRVAFFEVEDEVLSLIRAVNFAFCRSSARCVVPERQYR